MKTVQSIHLKVVSCSNEHVYHIVNSVFQHNVVSCSSVGGGEWYDVCQHNVIRSVGGGEWYDVCQHNVISSEWISSVGGGEWYGVGSGEWLDSVDSGEWYGVGSGEWLDSVDSSEWLDLSSWCGARWVKHVDRVPVRVPPRTATASFTV